MSFTAGQKLRASDLNEATLRAVVDAGAVVTGGLRVAMGSVTADFNNTSFAAVGADFTDAGFTTPPVLLAVANDAGSAGRIVVHSNEPTTTSAVMVAVTTTATNITAEIPIRWIAIGV